MTFKKLLVKEGNEFFEVFKKCY